MREYQFTFTFRFKTKLKPSKCIFECDNKRHEIVVVAWNCFRRWHDVMCYARYAYYASHLVATSALRIDDKLTYMYSINIRIRFLTKNFSFPCHFAFLFFLFRSIIDPFSLILNQLGDCENDFAVYIILYAIVYTIITTLVESHEIWTNMWMYDQTWCWTCCVGEPCILKRNQNTWIRYIFMKLTIWREILSSASNWKQQI